VLAGIPQHGLTLGSPDSPVESVEYSDLVCVTCAAVHNVILPPVVARYVRSGELSIEFRPVATGATSRSLALSTYAAAAQNLAWDFLDLAYLRSGSTGKAPVESASKLATVLDLDLARWRSDRGLPASVSAIAANNAAAAVGQFDAYPVFLLRKRMKPGADLANTRTYVEVDLPTSTKDFTDAIHQALTSGN
jgi:protein-disulfide isomerase